jgi:hypothetical protein
MEETNTKETYTEETNTEETNSLSETEYSDDDDIFSKTVHKEKKKINFFHKNE